MIDKKLIDGIWDAVAEINEVGYTLQCLTDAANYNVGDADDANHFVNMAMSVTQLLAKVLDKTTNALSNIADAIGDAIGGGTNE